MLPISLQIKYKMLSTLTSVTCSSLISHYQPHVRSPSPNRTLQFWRAEITSNTWVSPVDSLGFSLKVLSSQKLSLIYKQPLLFTIIFLCGSYLNCNCNFYNYLFSFFIPQQTVASINTGILHLHVAPETSTVPGTKSVIQ